MRKFVFLFLIFSSVTALYADYVLKPSHRKHSRIDHLPKGKVADMRRIPQDTAYYARQIKPWSRRDQLRKDREYNRRYFKPWRLKRLDIPPEDFGWEMRFVRKNEIYTEHGKRITAKTYEKWIRNANYEAKDSLGYYAITAERVNVRALPTTAAFYLDPKKPGEGFPFNYNQNSALHMNVPLYVSHFSKDKKWAFVQGSYAFGWVRIQDIAFVDRKFMRRFMTGKYAVTIKDDLRLYDERGREVSFVKLGTLFPVAKDGKRYLAAARTANAQAVLKKVRVSQKGLVARKPLPFNAHNVAKIAREFYGEPYGWGGGYGCRDCSATTRDFLGVFGIFLPRNSSKQANEGTAIPIKDLTPEAKKRTIVRKAEPFRSLLYVPGHIVLYLGQYKGEPVIMHTYWGVRKNDGTKLITARTIITTTEPGKERKDVRKRSMLSNTLQRIINF
jgi:cell wall-associated NlpC family hydrolase